MPVIPTVLAGATFANGLSAHFRDGYDMDGLQSPMLPKVADLNLPSTARQTPYAYYESAPYPLLVARGGSTPFASFASKSFTVVNYNYELAIGWHEDDEDDDQIQGLRDRAQQGGRNWRTLDQRIVAEIINGGTPELLPHQPAAPDGAGLYSATDGNGDDRFGISGGNIEPGTGFTTAQVRTGLWNARSRFARMKNTKGQPLWDTSMLDKGFTLMYSADEGVEQIVREAVLQSISAAGVLTSTSNAGVSNSLIESGVKFDLWCNPLLSGNNIQIFANGCPHKPIFTQMRKGLTERIKTGDNSDHAGLTGENWIQWKSRKGVGLWLPYGTVVLEN
jgi:hypothetical protein